MSIDDFPGLDDKVRIADSEGYPTPEFQDWFQTAIRKGVQNELAAQQAQEAAATAQEFAEIAGEAAEDAIDAADAASSQGALNGSGVVACVIKATDAGANASITISAHDRIYGNGTTLSIVGPVTLVGLAYDTTYFIYYDDPTRADTTPAYQTTTDEATAAQVGDRHLVGKVTTPVALGVDTDGTKVNPAGIGYLN